MGEINKSESVKRQYKTATNLNTRISIHSKYSTNKQGFNNWIFSHYEIIPDIKILELGCGTGDMWKLNLRSLDKSVKIALTDFSEGMIATAKDTLGEYENLSYNVVNIENIPYESEHFDRVIANMMLYHVTKDYLKLSVY